MTPPWRCATPWEPLLRPEHGHGAAEDVDGGAQHGAVSEGHGLVPNVLILQDTERSRGCHPGQPQGPLQR